MGATTLTLRRAERSDLRLVERLLAANDLPTADVREGPARFYVGSDDGEVVGVGGLERYGADGLLRSVVVPEPVRGEGYGTALCEALESEAERAGVETLYLLTTSAREFFADRGFAEADRETVPDAVRETTQFADLCPSSATCLRKSLSGTARSPEDDWP